MINVAIFTAFQGSNRPKHDEETNSCCWHKRVDETEPLTPRWILLQFFGVESLGGNVNVDLLKAKRFFTAHKEGSSGRPSAVAEKSVNESNGHRCHNEHGEPPSSSV